MNSGIIPPGLPERLRQAGRILVLTGSGVSAESGVPTFRDALTGLWAQHRPEDLATPEAFRRDPARVWAWYQSRRRRLIQLAPNGAHHAIVGLQRLLPGLLLVTQNVDGLHQRAGSDKLIELHGNLFRNRCRDCGHETLHSDPELESPPPCARCGQLMGPGVVWFGETLPVDALRRAWRGAISAEVFIAIGTSGMVYPAAQLADIARAGGALIVEVNTEATPLSGSADHFLRGPAGMILPALAEAVATLAQGDGGS
jgi:NAD-dependent deacetylase